MDDEGPGTEGRSFAMDDVTSRIAYAYAKQQVFLFLGALAVVNGVILTIAEWPSQPGDTFLGLADDILLLLGGLVVLFMVWREKDLKRVNRRATGVLALLLVVTFAVVAVSARGLFVIEGAGDLGDEIAISVVILLAILSYPFPTRRGGARLYSPAAIRELANLRTLAFASLIGLVAGISAFSDPAEFTTLGTLHTSFMTDDLFLAVLGGLAFVLFLVVKNGPKLTTWLTTLVVVELVASLFGVANEIASSDAMGDDWSTVATFALALFVVFVLSSRLNSGKTIVDRRG